MWHPRGGPNSIANFDGWVHGRISPPLNPLLSIVSQALMGCCRLDQFVRYSTFCIVLYYIVLYCTVLYCTVVIHFYSARAFQKRSRPQQLTLCRSLHAEALQATASDGFAQGPSVAARAGFEPATIWSKGIHSTNSSPRPLWRIPKALRCPSVTSNCIFTRHTDLPLAVI